MDAPARLATAPEQGQHLGGLGEGQRLQLLARGGAPAAGAAPRAARAARPAGTPVASAFCFTTARASSGHAASASRSKGAGAVHLAHPGRAPGWAASAGSASATSTTVTLTPNSVASSTSRCSSPHVQILFTERSRRHAQEAHRHASPCAGPPAAGGPCPSESTTLARARAGSAPAAAPALSAARSSERTTSTAELTSSFDTSSDTREKPIVHQAEDGLLLHRQALRLRLRHAHRAGLEEQGARVLGLRGGGLHGGQEALRGAAVRQRVRARAAPAPRPPPAPPPAAPARPPWRAPECRAAPRRVPSSARSSSLGLSRGSRDPGPSRATAFAGRNASTLSSTLIGRRGWSDSSASARQLRIERRLPAARGPLQCTSPTWA